MIALSNIPTGVYKALLVLATVIWGYSFVVMKHVVDVVPPALLLGVRFTLAGLLLLIILHKRVKKHFSWNMVACGAALALFDFSAFLTQTIGLQYTTPGINAFLTATYCVIVPFAWWAVAHKRPSICNVGAAVIAVIGIWLVAVTTSGETLTLGLGEGLTQICAPAQASLFLSLESVFGVIFSVLLYGEVVTARLLLGFTLIFAAILVNEILAPRLEAKRAIVKVKRKKWKEDEGNV